VISCSLVCKTWNSYALIPFWLRFSAISSYCKF
jgi:hypothetical protein